MNKGPIVVRVKDWRIGLGWDPYGHDHLVIYHKNDFVGYFHVGSGRTAKSAFSFCPVNDSSNQIAYDGTVNRNPDAIINNGDSITLAIAPCNPRIENATITITYNSIIFDPTCGIINILPETLNYEVIETTRVVHYIQDKGWRSSDITHFEGNQ